MKQTQWRTLSISEKKLQNERVGLHSYTKVSRDMIRKKVNDGRKSQESNHVTDVISWRQAGKVGEYVRQLYALQCSLHFLIS